MSFYAILTNCVCVQMLLIKFEVASVFISTARGGKKLCFEGFTYTIRSRKKNFVQWECSKRKTLNIMDIIILTCI